MNKWLQTTVEYTVLFEGKAWYETGIQYVRLRSTLQRICSTSDILRTNHQPACKTNFSMSIFSLQTSEKLMTSQLLTQSVTIETQHGWENPPMLRYWNMTQIPFFSGINTTPIVYTISVQYQCNTSTIPVQYQYNTSTIPVQYQYNTSSGKLKIMIKSFHCNGILVNASLYKKICCFFLNKLSITN